MNGSRQYLEWRGKQWRVQVKVPAPLRSIFGKAKLIYPLHTSSLEEANLKKWAIVGKFKNEIGAARAALQNNDPIAAEAIQLRIKQAGGSITSDTIDFERVEQIAEDHGWDEASAYLEVAKGMSTPLSFHQAAFLTYKTTYRQKSASDFLRVLGWLDKWLKDSSFHPYIEDLTRKIAGRFIDEFLLVGRSRKKVLAYLGFLREYWRWLKMRGFVNENPWLDQDLPQHPRPSPNSEPDGGKRPFTEQELVALLYGNADAMLRDLMLVATLSGMRIEEIAQLRVSDCQDGMFNVRQGKTSNAVRLIPIHSKLNSLVASRTEAKSGDEYLIHELPEPPLSRETRSDPASKRFTRYRRLIGVDERPNGKAKSNVDFHSFRRTFIRSARERLNSRNAGFTPWTLAGVVGHDDEGIKRVLNLTMRHYPGASSEDSKKALVESVKLPKKPTTPPHKGDYEDD